MYLSLEDTTERSRILNADLQKIINWSQKWKVDFNPTKTELVTFTNIREPDIMPLIFSNETLQSRSTHKHLGVIL